MFTTHPLQTAREAQEVVITEKELQRISALKTANQVLAVAEIPGSVEIDWTAPLILALDGIRDPGNMGTLIRTAKWFGIDHILCSEDCVETYSPKVVQSTMGALFHSQIHAVELVEVLKEAKGHGYRIVGTAMDGESLYSFEPTERSVVVIGSESHGMGSDISQLTDVDINIPNLEPQQKVESLNASVAAALVLYELNRKLALQ